MFVLATSPLRPTIFFFNWTLAVIVLMEHPLSRDDGSAVYNCCCHRQRNHYQVRVPWDSWPHFNVSDSRIPQPGGSGSRICPPETVWSIHNPRHWVPFSSPPTTRGLQWRYSAPPPHGFFSVGVFIIYLWGGPYQKHCLHQSFLSCHGDCLAIGWISFPRESVYRPLASDECSFLRSLHCNGTRY
jgi:hypothetical protein